MDTRDTIFTTCERGAIASARSACPHCGAGQDTAVVGLTWDCDEQAWRCVLCGHRTFPRPRRSPSQIEAELLWERLVADEEQNSDAHDQSDEWEEEVGEGALTSSSLGTSDLL